MEKLVVGRAMAMGCALVMLAVTVVKEAEVVAVEYAEVAGTMEAMMAARVAAAVRAEARWWRSRLRRSYKL